jgi:hypothetical protein
MPTTPTLGIDAAMKHTTTSRIAAFALAAALSTFTLAVAMPGGGAYLAGRILPGAGDAFETIAAAQNSTEVAIEPGRIDVVGVRIERAAAEVSPAVRS